MTKSDRIRAYFNKTYPGFWFVGASKDFITAIQKRQSGIPYGISEIPSYYPHLTTRSGHKEDISQNILYTHQILIEITH